MSDLLELEVIVSLWVLEAALRFSSRPASALNNQVISLPCVHLHFYQFFLYIFDYFLTYTYFIYIYI